MTPLEQESYHVFLMVRDRYSPGISRYAYSEQEVMGQVGRMIERLNNNRYGCATGEHRSSCSCRPAVKGKSIATLQVEKTASKKHGKIHA